VSETQCLPNEGGRRVFWTTMDSCGRYNLCGAECSIPGLQYIDSEEPYANVDGVPRTIANTDWIRSLVLNILNTRARSDIKCPTPAGTYGHWSENYRTDGLYIGTRLFNAAEKSYSRILDGVKAIGAAIQSDLGKLVIMGIATAVEVDAVYRGRSRVDITITIVLNSTRKTVNFSGVYSTDMWVWN
jgi:hypothetical protein